MMKHLCMGVAACLAIALPQAASAQAGPATATSGGETVSAFDEVTLINALSAIGGTLSEGGMSGDTKTYTVTFQNGVTGFAFFAACDQGCLGLAIAASFESPEGMSAEQRETIIRDFNDAHPEIKLFMGKDGDPLAQAYLIADGGISMKNMQVQLAVFAESAQQFATALYNLPK